MKCSGVNGDLGISISLFIGTTDRKAPHIGIPIGHPYMRIMYIM